MLGFNIKNTRIRGRTTEEQQTLGLHRKRGFPEQVPCLSIKEKSKEKMCYMFHGQGKKSSQKFCTQDEDDNSQENQT